MAVMDRIVRLLFVLFIGLAGCRNVDGPDSGFNSPDDLPGHRVAFVSGSIYDLMFSGRDDISVHGFNNSVDCLEALVSGQVDVFVDDFTVLPRNELNSLGVRMACPGEEGFECGIAMRKTDVSLRDSMSFFFDSLRATGQLQQIIDKWIECDDPSSLTMPDLGPRPKGKPIRMGMSSNLPPISFPVEREWRGLEPELLEMFSRYSGRPVEFEYLTVASSPAALKSGKIDGIGGGLFITDERKQTMAFTSSDYISYPGYFVKDASSASGMGIGGRLRQVFYNNLIKENRWRFITDGLWETVKISLLSILLGSLLGAGVCALRMSRRKWANVTAIGYINLMRGIPMLVLLMIMYYVVLSKTGMSASQVAVVAFAMNFAAYVSEMFRTSLQSVDRGQIEAGLALGYTPFQTFRYITAPQALKSVIPVFKGEAISLVKMTSIVGYIAIQDITRASDMIRSRTFDAFFPLLIVTLIYFLLAWILGLLLDQLAKPKKQ